MKLCQALIQFFDALLIRAHFKKEEQKDLVKRLFRIWLCRSATFSFTFLTQDQKQTYLRIIQFLDTSPDTALTLFDKLCQELRQKPDTYHQIHQHMLDHASTIVDELLKSAAHYLPKEDLDYFHHTFTLIKENKLPAPLHG